MEQWVWETDRERVWYKSLERETEKKNEGTLDREVLGN